jgi:hypothetical protein
MREPTTIAEIIAEHAKRSLRAVLQLDDGFARARPILRAAAHFRAVRERSSGDVRSPPKVASAGAELDGTILQDFMADRLAAHKIP